MNIEISLGYLRAFAKINERVKKIADRDLYWGKDDSKTEFEISNLEPQELEQFQTFLTKIFNTSKDDNVRGMMNGCLQKVSALKKIKEDPLIPVKSLDALASALSEYIRRSGEKWLFRTASDNRNLPYLVTSVKWTPASKGNHPADTTVYLKYVYLDEVKSQSITWYQDSLIKDRHDVMTKSQDAKSKTKTKISGYTVAELLDSRGYLLGYPELIEQYEKETEVYFGFRDQVGEQFTSDSVGYPIERHYRAEIGMVLNTDGTPHKLIVNEETKRKIKAEDKTSVADFWDENREETILRTPLHMYIRMFNLKDHDDYAVHTSTIKPYVYDEQLIDKLILPSETKELIEILGKGAAAGLGDIISGKAEGIIVGCVGAPGLGKSLSAEVYSEFLKRPLYSVQCAQLGTSPDKLEDKLNKVLENAQRWKAVLLLDEADVYIRKRAHDIHQNAIVGVFLRVLEYYRGIIFMTSNLVDSIDDAIESRFSAKIIYNYPTEHEATQIWAIQMENHGWKINREMIRIMVGDNSHLSGRSIRSLLKLGTLLARYRETDLTVEILKHASKFVVFEQKDGQFNPKSLPIVHTI